MATRFDVADCLNGGITPKPIQTSPRNRAADVARPKVGTRVMRSLVQGMDIQGGWLDMGMGQGLLLFGSRLAQVERPGKGDRGIIPCLDGPLGMSSGHGRLCSIRPVSPAAAFASSPCPTML